MKKGISIVTLVITIIIMAILAGVVVSLGSNTAEDVEINTFAVEILNIQTSVDEYYYRNNIYPTGETATINLSNIKTNSLSQFQYETAVSNVITLKKVNLTLLGIKDNEYGNNKVAMDTYAVSETTGKVYYLLGVEYVDKVYYTLTDEIYKVADVTNINTGVVTSENDIKKYDVIFSLNTIKPTNQPVIVNVKVPVPATLNSVTATESKSVSAATTVNGYKVITVNQTSAEKNGNYDISVTYTYNGVQKVASYSVNNFDNTKPTISYTEEASGTARVITLSITEEGSGINIMKYELSQISDETYFNNYGKRLNGNSLVLEAGEVCTIYVKDNAGNTNMLVIPSV